MPRNRSNTVLILSAVILSSAASIWLVGPPRASAASTSQITFTPASGPAGTHISVTITPSTTTTTTADYILGTTTVEPTGPTCASSQPIPGVAPVSVSPSGGQAAFDWPSSLNGGPYWLCASPSDTGSALPSYRSSTPFTVTTSISPTATPQPITVVIMTPASDIRPGATIAVQLSHWPTAGNTQFQGSLLTQDPAAGGQALQGSAVVVSIISQDGAGNFTLAVVLPTPLVTGTYWLSVQDGSAGAFSGPFRVNSPTPTPVPHATPTPSKGDGGTSDAYSTNAIIIAGLVALLVVLAGIFAVTRLRRH